MSNFKSLKITKGQPAEGEDRYFPREEIVKKILRKIDAGENILLSAPRRIGKSSILKYIENNPQKNQIIKYISVQSVDTSEEFFKKLYNELISDKEIFDGIIKGYYKRASASVRKYVSRISGFSISKGEIKVDKEENINYYDEYIKLIKSFKTDKKIIMFIDEFPDALNNILNIDKSLAINFLQQNRDIRMNFSDKNLQFVYTGSTGLSNVVKKIEKPNLINDIEIIKIAPFTHNESKELLQRLVSGFQEKDFLVDDNTIEYILEKIIWKIPYYMQIIIDELFDYYENNKDKKINNKTIDYILSEIVKSKSSHSDYFENWKSRLKVAFKNEDLLFAREILNYISKNECIEYSHFYDLSVKYEVQDYKYILNVLEQDGYISGDDKTYGFNSVLLKEWWYINVAT